MKRAVLTALICATGVMLFQNCTRTVLETPMQQASVLNSTGQLAWCLDDNQISGQPLLGYTVQSFYVRNVNVVPWVGVLIADSDGDGLPDVVEKQIGFDPQNPRSQSGALDRICYNLGNNGNSCPTVPSGCDTTANALGISACDIHALNLDQVFQHPTQGLDSDKDGIPDLFEIQGGTNPVLADADQDPDHDQVLNQDEYARGSNPLFSDADLSAGQLMEVNAQKLTGQAAGGCTGEMWQFNIDHVQYVPTLASNAHDTQGPLQAHAAGENIVIAVIKLRPNAGTSGNARIYTQTFVVNPQTGPLPFAGDQLQFAGEVLP